MGVFASARRCVSVGGLFILIGIAATSLEAGRARSSGGGAVIVWDGDRDVSIQNGTGDTDTLSELGFADFGRLAVLTRFVESNGTTSEILTEGKIPELTDVRLLLFAADLTAVCGAAAHPSFCDEGRYTTVLDAMGARFATSDFAKQPDPDKGLTFALLTDEEKEILGTKRLLRFNLVRSGTEGVWRLTAADRAFVQAVSDRFGAANVKVGLMSEPPNVAGFVDLQIADLAPAAGSAFAVSNGPRPDISLSPMPLSVIVDLDAGTGQTLYAATSSGRLQVSTNNGRTWNAGTDSRRVVQLAVNPANRAHLLAVFQQSTANSNHVSLSTNDGTTWTALSMPAAALGNGGITWAVFDPFTAGKLYAHGNGRLLTSLDHGSTWQDATIAFTPSEPAFSTVSGTFYVASQSGSTRGVYVTTNGGGTWTKLSAPVSSTETLYLAHGTQAAALFVADGRRVHRSVNDVWTSADVLAIGTITSLAVGPDFCMLCVPTPQVYAGTDRGMYFSAGGSTWTAVLNLQPAGAGYARVTAIVPGPRLAFGTQKGVWTYDPGEQTGTQPFYEEGAWGMYALTGAPASTVVKDVDWLELFTAPSITAGDATVVFYVQPSFNDFPRTGYITVAGRSLAISQSVSGCDYALSAASLNVGASGTTGAVTVTTGFCSWRAMSNATHVTLSNGPEFFGTDTLNFTVAANTTSVPRTTTISLAGRTFTIAQDAPPTLTAAKSALRFSAVSNGIAFTSRTADEVIRLTQNGSGTLPWTATGDQPWLSVSPGSSSGSRDLSIGVRFSSALPSGPVTGAVTVKAAGGRTDTLATIAVTLDLKSYGTTAPPIGNIDTPADNVTGVTGSIAVTGWAVDDVGIAGVSIWRDPVPSEGPGLRFIGSAVRVEGARPDVAGAHPDRPQASRAGWGYLLLTNFLPKIDTNGALGTGSYRLYAYADDAEGNATLLGSRTITCSNNAGTLPFGAIDTPGQGETVSGIVPNFGWVLSPGARRADPPNGTVSVLVDGVTIGSPAGWAARPDLTALFPAADYAGIARALGLFSLDTTTLTNAVHSIAWIVTDNQGGAAGVGSRYFTVANGSSVTVAPATTAAIAAHATAPGPPARSIAGRRGFDLNVPLQRYEADADGRIVVQAEELDRIELRVGRGARGTMRAADRTLGLPIGSRLDPETGIFTWQPGVAFVGPYDLVFDSPQASVNVRIILNPKGSARVGPQAVIDIPAPSGSVVADTFIVAGWAVDLDATQDAGVDTVHVWAYPVTGARPIFLGAALHGGERPDVAAIHGERFLHSGFGLIVSGLPAGDYDLAVFPYSTAKQRFTPAKVVRIRVGEER